MDDTDVLLKRLKLFSDRSTFIHISLKNGKFYNGFIQEICADYLEISDRRMGTVPVFFVEIYSVEPFTEAKNG
jgi:hypothetical protein